MDSTIFPSRPSKFLRYSYQILLNQSMHRIMDMLVHKWLLIFSNFVILFKDTILTIKKKIKCFNKSNIKYKSLEILIIS